MGTQARGDGVQVTRGRGLLEAVQAPLPGMSGGLFRALPARGPRARRPGLQDLRGVAALSALAAGDARAGPAAGATGPIPIRSLKKLPTVKPSPFSGPQTGVLSLALVTLGQSLTAS